MGIIIFLLGVSVGKKQAAAAGIPAASQSQFEDVVAEKPKPTAEEGDPISQEIEGHQAAQQETRPKPEEVTQPEVKTKAPAVKSAPENVAEVVVHAMTVPNPKARYLVGKDARRFARLLVDLGGFEEGNVVLVQNALDGPGVATPVQTGEAIDVPCKFS